MDIKPAMAVDACDGAVGDVRDLVIDPIDMRLTHLVVETLHCDPRARLIPIGAIYPELTVGHSRVVLLWTRAEVAAAPPAEHEDFVTVHADDETRQPHGTLLANRRHPPCPTGRRNSIVTRYLRPRSRSMQRPGASRRVADDST